MSSPLLHFNFLALPAMDPIMTTLNDTVIHQVIAPMNSSVYQSSNPPTVSGFYFGGVLGQLWSLITIWRLIVLFLVLGNLKNVPLIWHVSCRQLHKDYKNLTEYRCESLTPSDSSVGVKDQRFPSHQLNSSNLLSLPAMPPYLRSISIFIVSYTVF